MDFQKTLISRTLNQSQHHILAQLFLNLAEFWGEPFNQVLGAAAPIRLLQQETKLGMHLVITLQRA